MSFLSLHWPRSQRCPSVHTTPSQGASRQRPVSASQNSPAEQRPLRGHADGAQPRSPRQTSGASHAWLQSVSTHAPSSHRWFGDWVEQNDNNSPYDGKISIGWLERGGKRMIIGGNGAIYRRTATPSSASSVTLRLNYSRASLEAGEYVASERLGLAGQPRCQVAERVPLRRDRIIGSDPDAVGERSQPIVQILEKDLDVAFEE